ncbi:hypothetical protein AB0O76_05825 [Streptomyces sp. NPDC086554]|uniref:hypothetical protein n=1 Tax=Streptomyces sp. NPDC086554 TaxID=3154864 RepID=UPI003419B0BC
MKTIDYRRRAPHLSPGGATTSGPECERSPCDSSPSVSREVSPEVSLEQRFTLRAVTLTGGTVVALTFLFGFGNVWALASSLGVPPLVAPLVAPAVDLSVLGLLLALHHMAMHGARADQMRSARRLLIFSSVMTLALNVAAPAFAGQLGKAAFDAVGPLLLIGWAEVGPGLLQTISEMQREVTPERIEAEGVTIKRECPVNSSLGRASPGASADETGPPLDGDDLLDRARQEDARHREVFQRPISAETLRKQLRVGSARSRMLVAMVRADFYRPSMSGTSTSDGCSSFRGMTELGRR